MSSELNETNVLQVLSNVQDPDLNQDIVSLGFIKNLSIVEGKVEFNLELTTPACPIKEQLKQQCIDQVKTLNGVASVTVCLTAQERKNPYAGDNQQNIKGIKSIIAVSSCKGGVGKSTVATNLSIALQNIGAKVGLLDADIYGPSQPTMLGLEQERPIVDGESFIPLERYGIKMMSSGFLFPPSEAAVLRGPMISNVLQQILFLTQWGELDYLIIDMPPGTGDIQLTITQALQLSSALIVTTPQKISLVDVRKGIAMFSKVNVPILGLVENMSYFVCDNCDKQHEIFGPSGAPKLAEMYGLDVLGQIPFNPLITQGCDQGSPVSIDAESPSGKIYLELAQKVVRENSVLTHSKNTIPQVDIDW